MMMRNDSLERPGLLVSVRDAAEALAALDGGADVIDVKEPSRGPLGAADASTIAAVVRAVAGRAPVTAAAGELLDMKADGTRTELHAVPAGVALVKVGLAGCDYTAKWAALWRVAMNRMLPNCSDGPAPRPVAVVYADWRSVAAPDPNSVLHLAIESDCPALLVDTYEKSLGTLFDHWPWDQLAEFIREARSHTIAVVLAGSLDQHAIDTAVRLGPDLVAVRTAACMGGRHGTVASQRVRSLQEAIAAAATPKIGSPAMENRLASGALFASPRSGVFGA